MRNTIQLLREQRGLDRKAFADAIGVTRVTVWRWETNVTDIPYDTLKAIARFFQVTPASLLPDADLVPEETPHV